jgi:hypothetical protein
LLARGETICIRIASNRLSPAASAVAIELRDTARMLVTSEQWRGVSLIGSQQDVKDTVTDLVA